MDGLRTLGRPILRAVRPPHAGLCQHLQSSSRGLRRAVHRLRLLVGAQRPGMWAHLAYDERYGTPSPHEHRMSSWAAPLTNPDPGALHEAPFTMSRDGVPYTQTWRMGDENTAANEDSPRVAFAHFAAGQKPWEIYDEADVEPSERPVKRARPGVLGLLLRPAPAAGFVQRADEQCLTAYDARRLLTERAHERQASRSMKAAASSSLQP